MDIKFIRDFIGLLIVQLWRAYVFFLSFVCYSVGVVAFVIARASPLDFPHKRVVIDTYGLPGSHEG